MAKLYAAELISSRTSRACRFYRANVKHPLHTALRKMCSKRIASETRCSTETKRRRASPRSFRPVGLPIYVAYVPGAAFASESTGEQLLTFRLQIELTRQGMKSYLLKLSGREEGPYSESQVAQMLYKLESRS